LAVVGTSVVQRASGERTPRALPAPGTSHAVALTQVSWAPQRRLELEEWARQGRWLGGLVRAGQWWLGDWLRYGNAAWGERYTAAASITGYDPQTLMNIAYVASRFEAPRRRETVSFSHHAELAALPVEEQERWLDRVQQRALTLRALRAELRAARRLRAGARADNPAAASSGPETVCPACGHRFHESPGAGRH
jgi:hypothetical protein